MIMFDPFMSNERFVGAYCAVLLPDNYAFRAAFTMYNGSDLPGFGEMSEHVGGSNISE